jgi:hypothetical protein
MPGARRPFIPTRSVLRWLGRKPSPWFPRHTSRTLPYEEVRKYFSEKEIVDLTLVVTTINAWNRLAIALRTVPSHYRRAASAGAS